MYNMFMEVGFLSGGGQVTPGVQSDMVSRALCYAQPDRLWKPCTLAALARFAQDGSFQSGQFSISVLAEV